MDRRQAIKQFGSGIGLAILAPASMADTKADEPLKAEAIKGIGVLRIPAAERCRDIGRQIAENIKSGMILCLPNTRDYTGAYEWDFRIEGGPVDQIKIERSES
jgi:hypothetical protein